MLRTRRLDRARAAFEKVLAIDPSSATAYQNLGSVDLAGGRMTDAVDDLQRAVALDPRLFDALYNLGLALDALGRKDDARVTLERFVREAPRDRYAADVAEIEKRLAAKRNR